MLCKIGSPPDRITKLVKIIVDIVLRPPAVVYYREGSFHSRIRNRSVGCFMPAHLVSLTEAPSIPLEKPIVLVGRHPECDVQIDSRKISRRHCCVAHVNDYLIVRDLGSTNGIRINGVRVLEGRLREGDELTIGGHRYRVTWDGDSQSSPRENQESQKRREPGRDLEPVAYSRGDALESSDEPVALAEPFLGQRVASAPAEEDLPKDAAHLHRPNRPGPNIIPEKLGLAPVSDPNLIPPPRLSDKS
jgi:predicted component of type VI protein secretion system